MQLKIRWHGQDASPRSLVLSWVSSLAFYGKEECHRCQVREILFFLLDYNCHFMTSSVKLHDLIPFTSAINFPIMIQAVPTYLNGLYAKETQLLHPWSLAFGSILGLVYVFGMF